MICCSGTAPGAERVLVRHASFVLRVVDVQHLVFIHERSNRLAARAEACGHDDIDLVVQDETPGEGLVTPVVGLRVRCDQLDLAPQEALITRRHQYVVVFVEQNCRLSDGAPVIDNLVIDVHGRGRSRLLPECAEPTRAGRSALEHQAGVDLLDGKLNGVVFWQSLVGGDARIILDQPEFDRALVSLCPDDGGSAQNRRGACRRPHDSHVLHELPSRVGRVAVLVRRPLAFLIGCV